MYALGVNDNQIGLLLSVGMFMQVISALFSGIVTDKYGRRRVTFFMDIVSWSVPCLIWAFSQNFWWFLVAAVFNSMFPITVTSFQCLMIEDCEEKHLVNLFTWVNIAGLLSVFFAPLSTLFVSKYSLVPTVRMLYIIAFVFMTSKFIILYFSSKETRHGIKRMEETRNQSVWSLFLEYKQVFRKLFASRQMLLIMSIFVLINISILTTGNFFSLYITQNLGIPEEYVPFFPIARSAIMLIFSFLLQPTINRLKYRPVMTWGFVLYIVSHVVLLLARPDNLIFVIGYTVIEAAAYALVIPRKDSLGALFIDKEDRARILGLINVVVLAISAPFGTLIGWLSSINRQYPFILNIAIFTISALLVYSSKTISRYDSGDYAQ